MDPLLSLLVLVCRSCACVLVVMLYCHAQAHAHARLAVRNSGTKTKRELPKVLHLNSPLNVELHPRGPLPLVLPWMFFSATSEPAQDQADSQDDVRCKADGPAVLEPLHCPKEGKTHILLHLLLFEDLARNCGESTGQSDARGTSEHGRSLPCCKRWERS